MLKNQRLLVAVTLVAGFGNTAMSLTAAVWVKTLTGSSGLAALAGFFVFAPTLFGPWLGALVDRLPIRPVLVGTNLTVAVLLTVLTAVHSGHDVWLIYVVMLAYGLSYVVVDAAESRLIVATLPSEAIGGLNGLRMSAQEATKLVAPLVGAAVFAWAGGPAVAAISAATLLGSALLYLAVRSETIHNGPKRHGARGGLRIVATSAVIRTPVLVAAAAMFLSALGSAALYSVVDTALHRPAAFVGVLSSVQGAGAVVGGLVAGRLLPRLGETVFAAIGAVVFAVGPLVQATGWLPAVVAGSALAGIGLPWAVVGAMTAAQRHAPSTMVGSVAGSATTIVFAPPAVGIPLGALLVSLVDYRIPLVIAASGSLLAGTIATARRRTPGRPGDRVPPSTIVREAGAPNG